MPTTFAEALAPLRNRMPKRPREIEVLRISAQLRGEDFSKTAEYTRTAVLKWTTNRAANRDLPPAAWELQDFETLAVGRNRTAVRIVSDNIDFWALRAEDTDTDVASRVWCTEIVIGGETNCQPTFSLRLVASTTEREFSIDPSVPNIAVEMADVPGLSSGNEKLPAKPVLILTDDDAQELCDYLEDPGRSIPVFVTTLRDDMNSTPHINSGLLAKATAGLARTYQLPEKWTWALTDRLGKSHSVFHGGVRAYMPGFLTTDDPFKHRLFLGDRLQTEEYARACMRSLRSLAATHSIFRTRLGKDVLDFALVRTTSHKLNKRKLLDRAASHAEMLELAYDEVKSLEKRVKEKEQEINEYIDEIQTIEDRAQAAEQEYRSLLFRVRQLQEALVQDKGVSDAESRLPQNWSEFTDWLDGTYPDKIILTSAARRLARSPEFKNVELVARCIKWLATFQQNRRVEGGGSLDNIQVEKGIRNTPCNGDTYSIMWKGRSYDVDWHIKNGGNTRNPERCLRIYYFWEPELKLTVIDHLPSHRKTGMT